MSIGALLIAACVFALTSDAHAASATPCPDAATIADPPESLSGTEHEVRRLRQEQAASCAAIVAAVEDSRGPTGPTGPTGAEGPPAAHGSESDPAYVQLASASSQLVDDSSHGIARTLWALAGIALGLFFIDRLWRAIGL